MLVSSSFSSNPLLATTGAFVLLVFVISLLTRTNVYTAPSNEPLFDVPPPHGLSIPDDSAALHPIDELVADAHSQFYRLVGNEQIQGTVAEAAAAYRERRGRHPPPGFDRWVEFATNNSAVMLEDLFDQIYHDLEPFWALDPADIRGEALKWPFMFTIRNGRIRKRAFKAVAGEWLMWWERMFEEIRDFLPDVDLAMNPLDESRVAVPWETINEYMGKAKETRNTQKPSSRDEVVSEFPKLPALSLKQVDIGLMGLKEPGGKGPWLNPTSLWNLSRQACPPDSPARNFFQDADFTRPASWPDGYPRGTHHGYIANWTDAKSVCTHPHLSNMYGFFVHPRFNSVNTSLIPLFSGCKVAGVNNEILLPAAKYFSEEVLFASDDQGQPWDNKTDGIIWRGQATGGAHQKDNWKRFHRHRFAAMMNGTFVTREERSQAALLAAGKPQVGDGQKEEPLDDWGKKHPQPHLFPVPSLDKNMWNLSSLAKQPTALGEFIGPKADVGFDHLMCAPWVWSVLGDGKKCGYMDAWYKAKDRIPMAEQFQYKYLPDVDGNSYSGRYRAFLRSGSLPIKSTVWSEWHDSRLIPWKHFVPMDNTFVDLWGILEYFMGYGTREGERPDAELRKQGHDAVAKHIAEEGRAWADKVLRKEDMLIYVYRLVLEYKRVTSDDRAKMNWVEDLF